MRGSGLEWKVLVLSQSGAHQPEGRLKTKFSSLGSSADFPLGEEAAGQGAQSQSQ